MFLTQKFAAFIAGLTCEKLPPEAISQAKERIMDTVGAALAGRGNWEYARNLEQVGLSLGTGDYSIIGAPGRRFPAARAAMIDAVYAHSLELDDGHKNAGCHAGAVVVPTALVMGQALGRTGREVIAAVAAGYEVTYRIAAHVNPNQINRGFHPSSNCGVYGAAAAAGYLMGLNAEQLAAALGQAGMLASGTMEATRSGQRSKCVQVGNAAYNGIFAAYLAQSGMEGCLSALEGKDGLFQTQSADVDVEDVCRGLGEVYSIGDTYNKLYPCCRHAQPGIEGVLDLAREHSIHPEEVERIQIGTHQVAYDLTGHIAEPKNAGEAKFSLAYGAAAALVDGGFGVGHLTEQSYTKPEILALARRVACSIDRRSRRPSGQTRGQGDHSDEGRRGLSERAVRPEGLSRNPVGWPELEEKFRRNAELLLPEAAVDQLVRDFRELDTMERIDPVMELLSEEAPPLPRSSPDTAGGSAG